MKKGLELRLEGIVKRFENVVALDGVDLKVEGGELFAILGPSGCGKTTLLRIVAGLTAPDEGRVYIGGKDVTKTPAYERPVSMVFQNLALFPHLSVYKNIAFGMELRGLDEATIERRVREVMELVRLPYREFAHRRINQLSGGQQQRVAIARALAKDPEILLMDEPFSHLDYKVKLELIDELRRLQRELKLTTIYVTHDQNDAMMLADRLAVMNNGRVLQVGTPMEVYANPASPFVASFLGEANILRLEASEGYARLDGSLIPVSEEGEVLIAIRPEHIKIGQAESGDQVGIEGIVEDSVFMGPLAKIVVRVGNQKLKIYSESRIIQRIKVGKTVHLHWSTAEMKVYKPEK